MRSSTATGTTDTVNRKAPYRGRFAPSPTGLLHIGSLAAALASWLDARANHGRWLIRMEDLDTARVVPGAAEAILTTLAHFGLESDEPVLYQSTRREAYLAALAQLQAGGHCYRCTCSRSESSGVYSGHCRDLALQNGPAAWRLRLAPNSQIEFVDAVQGHQTVALASLGDPIIYRRDGIAAYQLAVVVDDAAQGITHVVRGADLLESTAWQIALAQSLQLPVPSYAHIPLLTEPDGSKLAKSRRSLPLDPRCASQQLVQALSLLQQQPIEGLTSASVRDILDWSAEHWRPAKLIGVRTINLQK